MGDTKRGRDEPKAGQKKKLETSARAGKSSRAIRILLAAAA